MASELARKECVPCKGGVPPLKGADLEDLQRRLGQGWQVIDEHHLEKEYKLGDWKGAVEFVNRISDLAEQQDHHPDIHLSYGKVKVQIWTHKIDGLTESEFVFAAKVEELPRQT